MIMSYCKCGGSYSRGGKGGSCVCETARKIAKMQYKAEHVESCLGCDARELGENCGYKRQYNTRPVILYLPCGKPFKINVCPEETCKPTSCIFRIEKVERCGCCATVRALMVKEIPSRHGHGCKEPEFKLVPTPYCATVDLEKFVAIQCLHDTYIPC